MYIGKSVICRFKYDYHYYYAILVDTNLLVHSSQSFFFIT